MCKYILIIIVIFCSRLLVTAHVDPIATTDGSMILNQNFKGNFAMEFIFSQNQNVVLQDIGIEFFNVGDDDTASIYMALYDKQSNTLVKYSDTVISSIYNQTVFVDFFVSLEGNKSYLLVYGSKNQLNDDQLNYFRPNNLPYTNAIMPLSIQQIYHDNQVIPTTSTTQAPFLSFGIASQTGIDFIADKIVKKLKSDPFAKEYHTVFETKTTKLKLTSIGLSYLDVGPNLVAKIRLSIRDFNSNHVLLYLDTTVVNLHGKKIDFPASLELDTTTTYTLEFENLDTTDIDNVLMVYKPTSLPYSDNLNFTQINAFYKNSMIDTVGIAFYMNYVIPKSSAGIETQTDKSCYLLKENKQFITVDFVNIGSKSNSCLLFALDGRNYSSRVSATDTGLVIDKLGLNYGLYVLNLQQKCGQSLKLLVTD